MRASVNALPGPEDSAKQISTTSTQSQVSGPLEHGKLAEAYRKLSEEQRTIKDLNDDGIQVTILGVTGMTVASLGTMALAVWLMEFNLGLWASVLSMAPLVIILAAVGIHAGFAKRARRRRLPQVKATERLTLEILTGELNVFYGLTLKPEDTSSLLAGHEVTLKSGSGTYVTVEAKTLDGELAVLQRGSSRLREVAE